MFTPRDLRDDLSLEASRVQRMTVGEALRKSLSLKDMSSAPRCASFTAILHETCEETFCERYETDDEELFGTPKGVFPASHFIGWLPGTEEPYPRIPTRDDEYAWDAALGREED